MPEEVLINSGHVERFSDFIVKDEKSNIGFRADKLIQEFIEKALEKEKGMSEERKTDLKLVYKDVEVYNKQ